ncbi:MAG: alkaline phosphatase family protein, partial [Candidatus Latescibacteria bacterium]|nr:alkaline phosphatase family protein [Candidatus Latescibacterota bacterium]
VMILWTASIGADPVRVAFGSCARIDLPQPIWHTIASWQPDVFVTLGDIVYADTEDMTLMQAMYAQMDTVASFRKLCSVCSVYGIWDDHDYGVNDGGASYAKRDAAQQLFLDFLKEPADSERRKTPGIYDAVYLDLEKRVQLILLDTRFFRSDWVKDKVTQMRYRPVYDTEKTMLGDAQWDWLEAQLRMPAQVRIIASGVQVVNDTHGYECWGLFPLERARMFRLIRNTKASGVVFLSGDRHFAELSVMDGGVGYPMYDLTSSGLTHTAREGHQAPNNKRVGAAFNGFNFGALTIDLDGDEPEILLEVRGMNTVVPMTQKILLKDLQF